MATRKPTGKQVAFLQEMLADSSRSLAETAVAAGYSPRHARAPSKITRSLGFLELAARYLPDRKLLEVATAGLDADKVTRFKDGQEFTDPDYYARHQYLETALRIRNLAQSDDIPIGDITINLVNYAAAESPTSDKAITIKAKVSGAQADNPA
jgi:hypothetical protein